MYRKELHEILDLVLDINEKSEEFAFFDFAGHVGNLTVRLCRKDDEDFEAFYRKSVYVTGRLRSTKQINAIIKYLKNIKEGKANEGQD